METPRAYRQGNSSSSGIRREGWKVSCCLKGSKLRSWSWSRSNCGPICCGPTIGTAQSRSAYGPARQRQDLFGRSLGGRSERAILIVRYEAIIGSYLGETAQRISQVFDYARSRRCVLFFDEFDAVAKERGDVNETGEIKRVVSSLLLLRVALPSYVVAVYGQ